MVEWEAVACVIVYGMKYDYFLIQISAVVIREEAISEEVLVKLFESYIMNDELEVLKQFMSQEISQNDNKLLEVLVA